MNRWVIVISSTQDAIEERNPHLWTIVINCFIMPIKFLELSTDKLLHPIECAMSNVRSITIPFARVSYLLLRRNV